MNGAKVGVGRIGWAFLLSVIVGVALLTSLIYAGGFWDIVANTRVLDFMTSAGIVSYHDNQHGFIKGLPDLKYYLWSQDPVRWDLIAVVVLIFLIFFALKAIQFHSIARFYNIETTLRQNMRAYAYGMLYNKFLPFNIGNAATALALQGDGASHSSARAVIFTGDAFIVFEIVVYGLFGLLLMGWSTGFGQIFWSLVILGTILLILRGTRGERWNQIWQATRSVFRSMADKPLEGGWIAFLSILAFGLEDIAAYFSAMAFTSQHVILSVDFSILLLAVVASYIARLVPFTPGGIGQFEWGFATGLWFMGGVALPEAATIAILDNVFRYLGAALFYIFAGGHRDVKTNVTQVFRMFRTGTESETLAVSSRATTSSDDASEIPVEAAPAASPIWWRTFLVTVALLCIFYFDRITFILFDYWLLESLGYVNVFWTNFNMGALLFFLGFVTMAVSIFWPALSVPLASSTRMKVLTVSATIASLGGYFLCRRFLDFLLFTGDSFNRTDPVFGLDYGFYVYSLSVYWDVWNAAFFGTMLGLGSAIICQTLYASSHGEFVAKNLSRFERAIAIVSSKSTRFAIIQLGVVVAAGLYISRYNLLTVDNSDSAIYSGAGYVDVVGLFSTLHYLYLSALIVIGLAFVVTKYLKGIELVARGEGVSEWAGKRTALVQLFLILIAVDFGFRGMVAVRDVLFVRPNEPVIQLDFIKHHVDSTRMAYKLENIEEVSFVPNGPGDPAADVEALVQHPTIKNAPLWPGFTSHLELWLDYQHSARILIQNGDTTIYGPSLDIFRQQQKLRMYYDFLGMDSVRYRFGGDKMMFTSSVREAPLIEPYPWLAWFGQRYMLFTHGYGLVAAPVAKISGDGEPEFVSYNIPIKTSYPELDVKNPRVYYGEGSATMAYSNVNGMKELDYPTDQDRVQLDLPQDFNAGVRIDSLLKRIAFGWRSAQFFEVVFSNLIGDNTRVHFFRTPVERLEHVAPFLYFDSNKYAVAAGDQIVWLVNAMTTSDQVPYSRFEELGDKSDERSISRRPIRWMNYLEDSVKCTVNAADGMVRFYKFSNDPVINTWSRIYPDLFSDIKQMPENLRVHVTYPVHLFHAQFDDLYIYYHMQDPMYFFNQEDLLDDADEVVGPVLGSGQEITFSIEPFNFLLETGKAGIPAAKDPVQFVMAMVFTPQNALNLRTMPIVYQDGEDYGKIVVLNVPKGTFFPGPEQADSAIDQQPEIGRQLSWWNRRGTDVIRGHTSTLIIGNEVVYVEPLFIRSQQNLMTQMKQVSVVYRGTARMGDSLEAALRAAIAGNESRGGKADIPWQEQQQKDENAPNFAGRDEGPGGTEPLSKKGRE